MPDAHYQKHLSLTGISIDAGVDTDQGSGSHTLLPNDFEREFIFCGSWSPSYPTPGASSTSPYQLPFAGSQTPEPSFGFQSPVPWTPASLSPQPSSCASSPSDPSPPSPALSPPDHWNFHPNLVGILIRVDISGGGELDTSKKKNGAIVEVVSNEDSFSVLCCRSPTKSVPAHHQFIQSFQE